MHQKPPDTCTIVAMVSIATMAWLAQRDPDAF
jgi:hypothetical protein